MCACGSNYWEQDRPRLAYPSSVMTRRYTAFQRSDLKDTSFSINTNKKRNGDWTAHIKCEMDGGLRHDSVRLNFNGE